MDEPTAPFEPIRHKEIQDDTPDPEEICRLRERSQILNAAILRLRPRLRRVVELQQLQEHSLLGIARILGISTATVKARMFTPELPYVERRFCKVLGGQFGLAPGRKEECQ